MGIHLSGVVAGAAALPALISFAFRRVLPLPAALVLWHVAGTGFVVAIAASAPFARHTTWIMGKRRDGTISPVGVLLAWPYHAGLRAKLALQRKMSSEDSWNKVGDNYYLGSWPSEEALVPAVHPAVLDVNCELPLQVKPPAYLMLPVWDTHSKYRSKLDCISYAGSHQRQLHQECAAHAHALTLPPLPSLHASRPHPRAD